MKMKLCSKLPLNQSFYHKKISETSVSGYSENRRLCYSICYFQRVINVFSYCFDVFSIKKTCWFCFVNPLKKMYCAIDTTRQREMKGSEIFSN